LLGVQEVVGSNPAGPTQKSLENVANPVRLAATLTVSFLERFQETRTIPEVVMARPRKLIPRYLEHSQSGRARAVWTDANGGYHEKLLPGAHGSEESRTAFGRLLLEMDVAPTAPKRGSKLAMVQVLAAYHEHAKRYYRDADGKPTSTMHEIRIVLRAVRELYGSLPVAEFTPLRMKAAMAGWVTSGCSRTEVNRRLGIVKRILRWAASEELIPAAVYHGLTVVNGLKRGRTTAHETDPVEPVDDEVVDATLPHLSRPLVGLVEFQHLTGCRPGEACRVRRRDLDTGGAVWLYRPAEHKTAWRGKVREIAVGPRAQALLREFFTPDLDAYLFAPVGLPNAPKRKGAGWTPKEKYDRTSYTRAIARACEAAGVPHWHPNQLRHTFATRVRKAHGLEAAQVLLGHARADVTQVYAERDRSLSVEIAARIG
jgi:integrase